MVSIIYGTNFLIFYGISFCDEIQAERYCFILIFQF